MGYRYAVIGCGKPRSSEGATGYGMSHQHAIGFKAAGCTLVAAADIRPENAEAFVRQHGDPSTRLYTDYRAMLAEVKPEVVSVCTWPALHAEMTLAAIDAGAKAVHCEKPMSLTFGEAKAMHTRATARGCQLTFNHQRRFNTPFVTARRLLHDQVVGRVRRIESITSNLYDWGTHWFDMIHCLNEESPAEWVIGQVDVRGRHTIFGAPIEGQGLSLIKFRNDVRATMITGYQLPAQAQFTIHGDDGTLEIEPPKCGNNHVRYRNISTGGRWHDVPSDEGIHGEVAIHRGCADVISCLQTGREPELSSRRALQATEVMFATYESSRRRGRVDLPLMIDDSPLVDLLAVLPATGAR